MWTYRWTEANEFDAQKTGLKEDKFEKVFHNKATKLNLWPCWGAWGPERLAGAIAWTVTKREPRTANLQLLHVFSGFRRKGIATELCHQFLTKVLEQGALYFRVAAEKEAVPFYESLGVQFLGKQKSGGILAVGKLVGVSFRAAQYGLEDGHIRRSALAKKGGCTQLFSRDL